MILNFNELLIGITGLGSFSCYHFSYLRWFVSKFEKTNVNKRDMQNFFVPVYVYENLRFPLCNIIPSRVKNQIKKYGFTKKRKAHI